MRNCLIHWPFAACCFLFLFLSLAPGTAQLPCAVIPPPPQPSGNIFFNPEQESELGDIIAARTEHEFRLLDDPQLTGYIRQIGNRLLKQFPPGMSVQIHLIDLPETNAFTTPGGRIYVTRKLIALTQAEDELAGVLGHELGHVWAHTAAARVSADFQAVLGVDVVGDRQDIYENYNRLLDRWRARLPHEPDKGLREGREEARADQVAIQALARAGYDPKAFVNFFDRLAETKGKTGDWLSDLFGMTTGDSQRLREALKDVAALPPECIDVLPAARAYDFARWRRAVIEFSGPERQEVVPGLISRRRLRPGLRPGLNHVRFSPDGKFLLAQDDGSVYVLSRTPLAVLFQIDAPDALPAQFTPNSSEVVVYDAQFRVQRWSVESRKRGAVYEVSIPGGCLQHMLSPDGWLLACLAPGQGDTADFGLRLLDVGAGTTVFEEPHFYAAGQVDLRVLALMRSLAPEDSPLVRMAFSPDGRYFLAARDAAALAVDIPLRKAVALPGDLRDALQKDFAFISNDTLAGIGGKHGEKSRLVKFPSGQSVRRLDVAPSSLAPVTHGDYVLLQPLEYYALGVFDVRKNRLVATFQTTVLDIYDDAYLGESRSGELALYKIGEQTPETAVELPESRLSRVSAAAVSPNLKVLAVSSPTRGALWDLSSGERLFHLASFSGVWMDGEDAAYAEFLKADHWRHRIVRMDLHSREIAHGIPLQEDENADTDYNSAQPPQWQVQQDGRFLITQRPGSSCPAPATGVPCLPQFPAARSPRSGIPFAPFRLPAPSPADAGGLASDTKLEVRDVGSGDLLWSRHFGKEAPRIFVSAAESAIVLEWDAASAAARDEIEADGNLAAALRPLRANAARLLIVVAADSGKTLGKMVLDAGSVQWIDVQAAGDWLSIVDDEGRVSVYALATGRKQAVFFGHNAAFSRAARLILVENAPGEASLYDLATGGKRKDLSFSSGVAWAQFSPDGKKLLVLTRDQTVFVIGNL
jgi:hypothetical protein